MPIDYSRYPANWLTEIRPAILERATVDGVQRCEWCGVANGAVGAWNRYGEWWDESDIAAAGPAICQSAFDLDYESFPKTRRIVLTIAHLGTPHPDGTPGDKHDKHDCRAENLAALCNRCHLNYDREDHIAPARETRARKRGQLTLDMAVRS